ncbi:MAG: hypothetical protein J6L69_03250 [Lachnospiraceae bacterium]|nr:hypothetical protein [Lachnospiraceae bacterium]
MIIRELLTEESLQKDKDVYAKLGGWKIWPGLSNLYIDREKDAYIRIAGKNGVEAPIISYMYYKEEIIEFSIWETGFLVNQGAEDIEVKIKKKMLSYKSQIEGIIREFYDVVERYSFSPIKRLNFLVKLDNVAVRRRYYLESIKDDNCKDIIEDAINSIDGLAAEFNLKMKVAFISMERDFDNEFIIAEIKRIGYKVIDVKNGFYSWENNI